MRVAAAYRRKLFPAAVVRMEMPERVTKEAQQIVANRNAIVPLELRMPSF
ncbi:MAG: hypothetical protein AAF939_22030 [Planctomycetota bacterium]